MNAARRLVALLCVAVGPAAAMEPPSGGCGAVEPAPADGVVRLARDVQPIFDENCVACHQTGSAMQGLILEQGRSHANLVGRPSSEAKLSLVQAGNPERSYLLNKVSATHRLVGGSGEAMPLGGVLDARSVAILCRWIAAGARDD